MRFFRTPKGLLLVVLVGLVALAAPHEGVSMVARGLVPAVAAAALVDLVILRVRTDKWKIPDGAMLTALIVAMVLSSREPWYVVTITAVLGVVSKYVLRAGGANIFNPAAFAMVATFYVFNTGQSWWGALPELPLWALSILVLSGAFIADRVNKLMVVVSFLGVYFACFTVAAYAGPPVHVAEIFRAPDLHASIYFAAFILTDPPTSPIRLRDQIICGVLVALVSFAAFELIGAAYYLLAGVLVGNAWEAARRAATRRQKTKRG